MNKILIALLIFLNYQGLCNAQTSGCTKKTQFGNTVICIPDIAGMIECYDVPTVKEKADMFENAGNSILGFYIKDELYEQMNNTGELNLSEYFKIYAVNTMKDKEYQPADLDEISGIMGNNFLNERWSSLKDNLEKDHGYLKFGQPVIIENYKPNENTLTYIMIGKISGGDEDLVITMAMNILLIRNRIIWTGYYLKYDGDGSIQTIKTKSDLVASSLISENS